MFALEAKSESFRGFLYCFHSSLLGPYLDRYAMIMYFFIHIIHTSMYLGFQGSTIVDNRAF